MANKWLTTTAIALGLAAAPAAAHAEAQWRLFGGASSPSDLEASYYGYDAEITAETGFVVGIGLGVVRGDFVFEGELAHRTAELDQFAISGFGSYDLNGDLTATSLMANGWYHVPSAGNWGFYLGGGVGIAQVEIDTLGYSYDASEFAWQLGAGINLKSESGFAYGLGYRYFNVPEIDESDIDAASHDVVFEISRRF